MSVSLHNDFSIQRCEGSLSYSSQQISTYADLINEGFIGIRLDLLGVAVEKSVAFAAIAVGALQNKVAIAYIPRTTPTEPWIVANRFHVSAIITDTLLEGSTRPNRDFVVPDLGRFYIYALDNKSTYCKDNDILFVIRTSGTTGEPKIVHVPYKSIQRNVDYYAENFLKSGKSEPILWTTNLTFDPSFLELYTAIVHGAVLLIPSASWYDNNDNTVPPAMQNMNISFVHITPTKLLITPAVKLDYLLQNVRHLLVGGEAFPVAFFKRYRSIDRIKANIYNIYGITELSCWASIKLVSNNFEGTTVDIGEPFPNTSVQVTDGKVVISSSKCFVGFVSVKRVVTEDEATVVNGKFFVQSRLKLRGVRMTDDAVRCVLDANIPHIIHASLTALYHVTILVVVVDVDSQNHDIITQIEKMCSDELVSKVDPLQRPVCVIGVSHDRLTTNQNGKIDFKTIIKQWLEPEKCLLILKNMGIQVDCPMDTKLSTLGLDSLQIVELSNLLMTLFRNGSVTTFSLVHYFRRPDTTIGDVLNLLAIYEKDQQNQFKMPVNVPVQPLAGRIDSEVRTWKVKSCVDGTVYSFANHYVTATVEGDVVIIEKGTDSVQYVDSATKAFFAKPKPGDKALYIGYADGNIYLHDWSGFKHEVYCIANVGVSVSASMLLDDQCLYIPGSTTDNSYCLECLDLSEYGENQTIKPTAGTVNRLILFSSPVLAPSIQGEFLHLPCAREYLIISKETLTIVERLELCSPILRDQFYWKGHLLAQAFLGKVYISSSDGRSVHKSGVLPPATASPVILHHGATQQSDIWCLPTASRLFIVRATLIDDLIQFEPMQTLEIGDLSGFLHPPVKLVEGYWVVMSSTGQIFVIPDGVLAGVGTASWKQLKPISQQNLEIMGTPMVYGNKILFGSRNDAVFEVTLDSSKFC